MPPVTLPWKASSQASLLLAMLLLHRPLPRQSLLKMLLAFGTTPAQKAVKAAVAQRKLAQNAEPPWYTMRLITHQRTQHQRKRRLLTVPSLCQMVLRQLLLQPKLLSLHKMQKVFGITPVRQVVPEVLEVLLLAQNAARRWRITRLITSKKRV